MYIPKKAYQLLIFPFITFFSFTHCSTNQYITLFSHGLGGNHEQAFYYSKNYSDQYLFETCNTFNFLDALRGSKEVNLGQQKDITTLAREHQKILSNQPHEKTILFGVSRGGATAINYLSTTSIKRRKNIAALIIESSYDHISSVVEHKLGKASYIPGLQTIGLSCVKLLYPSYDKNGIHPIEVVEFLPKDIPIVFIHSKKDSLIPINASRRLYKKLKELDHKKLYLIELNNGAHANILWGTDGNTYKNGVHAILQKHNLPHNSTFAKKGRKLLRNFQPTLQEINRKIKNS